MCIRDSIKSGQELAITQENVSCYPGAKEGYNMPLTCNDEVIGVIGIYGVPSAVQDLAKLLKVYAAKYFEMEINMQQAFQLSLIHIFCHFPNTVFHLSPSCRILVYKLTRRQSQGVFHIISKRILQASFFLL